MSILNTMQWPSSGTDDGWVDYLDGYENYLSVCKYRVETTFDGSPRFLLIYGQRNSDDAFTLTLPENLHIKKKVNIDYANGVMSTIDRNYTFNEETIYAEDSHTDSIDFSSDIVNREGVWFMGIFEISS